MNGIDSDEIKLLPRTKEQNPKKHLLLLILCLLVSNSGLYLWLSPSVPVTILVDEGNVLVQIPASKNLLGPGTGKKLPISITNQLNQLLVIRGHLHPSGEAGMDLVEVPKGKAALILQQKNSLLLIPYGTYRAQNSPTRNRIHEIIF